MQPTQSLKELRAHIQRLEQQARELERAQKPGVPQVVALINRYRLTSDDIDLALRQSKVPGKRGVPKGTRLRPKYRNPQNARQTWAGRGLKPAWLQALLKQGRKLEEFEI